jgi:hypothetical protein
MRLSLPTVGFFSNSEGWEITSEIRKMWGFSLQGWLAARKERDLVKQNLEAAFANGQEERAIWMPSYGETHKEPKGWISVPNYLYGFLTTWSYGTSVWQMEVEMKPVVSGMGILHFFSVIRTFHSKICSYWWTNPNDPMLPQGSSSGPVQFCLWCNTTLHAYPHHPPSKMFYESA